MKSDNVLRRLDKLIETRSILLHPFYQAWKTGDLTRDQLATYSWVYYPHVASFPCYLERILDQTQDETIRFEIQQNLVDELSNPKPHPELWLDFAEGVGADREKVREANPWPAARETVKTFNGHTGRGVAEGLAALYAYESQQPEVSREKLVGLRDFYGIRDDKTLAYFRVHAETDIRHRDGERRAIRRCVENGVSQDDVLGSAEKALDAYWGLLDGICEQAWYSRRKIAGGHHGEYPGLSSWLLR